MLINIDLTAVPEEPAAGENRLNHMGFRDGITGSFVACDVWCLRLLYTRDGKNIVLHDIMGVFFFFLYRD